MTAPPHRPRDDARDVAALIGREPFTRFKVAVRCPHGGPAVVENDPIDLHGRPFPTRYWLACRALHEAVSRIESTGAIRELDADAVMTPHVEAANRHHARLHDGARIAGSGDPRRAKCLHAHVAFGLATGGGPVLEWIGRRADLTWPATCCLDRVGDGA